MNNKIKTLPVEPLDIEWLRKAAEGEFDEPLMSCGMAQRILNGLEAAPDDELARLEHTLSEWFCDDVLEIFQLHGILTSTENWSDISVWTSGMRVESLRWLEYMGQIERHPTDPNLVRLKEQSDE